jgi:phosphoribosylformylglycinamidine synthase
MAAAAAGTSLGAHLEIPASAARLDRLLFAEGGARLLVSVAPGHTAAWQQALDQANAAAPGSVPAQCLGVVEADRELSITQAGSTVLELPIAQLRERFEQAIPRRMGVDLPPSA